MKSLLLTLLASLACAACATSPAFADNMTVKDATNTTHILATTKQSNIDHPKNLIEGVKPDGTVAPVNLDSSGNIITSGGGGGGGGGGATTISDGADVTQGAKADNVCSTDTGTCTGQALLKRVNQILTAVGTKLDTLNSYASSSTPTDINNKQINGVTPSVGAGTSDTGSQRVVVADDNASVAINVSTATTTQLVALSSGKKVYVTSYDLTAWGTTNAKLVYGTGTNCGTGTADLTGNYALSTTAMPGLVKGNGAAAVLVTPASQAVCVVNSAAIQLSGSLSYNQH